MGKPIGYEWDDEELQSMSTKETGWYRAKSGCKDVIKIIDKFYPIYVHNFTESGKFNTRICSMHDPKEDKCPYCEIQNQLIEHRRAIMFATSILHIARKEAGGSFKPVGKLLAWRFGDDKRLSLLETNAIVGGIKKVELHVSVKGDNPDAEKFQKLEITHLPPDKFILKKLPKEIIEQVKNELGDKNKDETRKRYLPSYDDLAKWLNKEKRQTDFEPENFDVDLGDSDIEEEEKEVKPKLKKKGRPKKVKDEEEEGIESDEELIATEEDVSDDDENPFKDLDL